VAPKCNGWTILPQKRAVVFYTGPVSVERTGQDGLSSCRSCPDMLDPGNDPHSTPGSQKSVGSVLGQNEIFDAESLLII
jgi:hypothetical protein